MLIRMKKLKMLIFATPPIKNQWLWVPMEAVMKPKWDLKLIFIPLENDT